MYILGLKKLSMKIVKKTCLVSVNDPVTSSYWAVFRVCVCVCVCVCV